MRLEIEEVEEIGDNVVTFVNQVGHHPPRRVELEQPSAAVWKFRGGMLVRVEFHLDRDVRSRARPRSSSSCRPG